MFARLKRVPIKQVDHDTSMAVFYMQRETTIDSRSPKNGHTQNLCKSNGEVLLATLLILNVFSSLKIVVQIITDQSPAQLQSNDAFWWKVETIYSIYFVCGVSVDVPSQPCDHGSWPWLWLLWCVLPQPATFSRRLQSYLTSKMQSTHKVQPPEPTETDSIFNMIQWKRLKWSGRNDAMWCPFTLWLEWWLFNHPEYSNLFGHIWTIKADAHAWGSLRRFARKMPPKQLRRVFGVLLMQSSIGVRRSWTSCMIQANSGLIYIVCCIMQPCLSSHSQNSAQSVWVHAHALACTRYTATNTCQCASSPAVWVEDEYT